MWRGPCKMSSLAIELGFLEQTEITEIDFTIVSCYIKVSHSPRRVNSGRQLEGTRERQKEEEPLSADFSHVGMIWVIINYCFYFITQIVARLFHAKELDLFLFYLTICFALLDEKCYTKTKAAQDGRAKVIHASLRKCVSRYYLCHYFPAKSAFASVTPPRYIHNMYMFSTAVVLITMKLLQWRKKAPMHYSDFSQRVTLQ